MVVHGGQIRGANLHSISETLTPLIGAGIDRILHAQLQFGVPPIELSAMTDSRVEYLSPPHPIRAADRSICWNTQFHRPDASDSYPISWSPHSAQAEVRLARLRLASKRTTVRRFV
jgi:hypothetical protein